MQRTPKHADHLPGTLLSPPLKAQVAQAAGFSMMTAPRGPSHAASTAALPWAGVSQGETSVGTSASASTGSGGREAVASPGNPKESLEWSSGPPGEPLRSLRGI